MPKALLPIQHKKATPREVTPPAEPFRWLSALPLSTPLSRWFDELWPAGGPPAADLRLAPPVDVVETPDAIVLTAEVPGIRKEDVRIQVEDGVLSIAGEKEERREQKEANLCRSERRYGAFYRSLTLPGSVEAEKIVAEMDAGVLTVRLPKRESAKPKTIPVR